LAEFQIRIAILTQDRVFLLGAKAILDDISEVASVAHCETWESTAELATQGIDLLILPESEVHLFNNEFAESIRRTTKIVMLLTDPEADEVFIASLSVDGFLLQSDLSGPAPGDAMRRIVDGEFLVPAAVGQQLLLRAASPTQPQGRAPGKLTARQAEALTLLAEGLSNKQIARRLRISPHGAKRIVASLLVKLDAPNRTAAVVTAIQAGLLKMATPAEN
jgi:two-component system nitrate/nitrite response regulator NarL